MLCQSVLRPVGGGVGVGLRRLENVLIYSNRFDDRWHAKRHDMDLHCARAHSHAVDFNSSGESNLTHRKKVEFNDLYE